MTTTLTTHHSTCWRSSGHGSCAQQRLRALLQDLRYWAVPDEQSKGMTYEEAIWDVFDILREHGVDAS